jgi:predicted ATP-grasp superfamily ATP-dependent carboligase
MGKPLIAVENVRLNTIADSAMALPPVIVLNLFHSGLGIARQLAGKGIRVVGLSAHPRIYGNYTRLCEVRVAPNSQEQSRELRDFLLRIASELCGAIIFPTRDADMLFLDRFRDELEPFYRLAIPPRHVLYRVLDKAVLAEKAMEAGIPVPRTTVVLEPAGLDSGAERVGFPCVVKPVTAVHWRQGTNWKLVGGKKAFRVNNLIELQQTYERVSQARREILLQEWIPGDTDQIVVWGGYVQRELEPVICFTARKLLQSPSEFGTGCVVESDRIPDLLEPTVRLCRALGYEGIAEVEFKRDARDGTLKLIEVNARHWDWHQLGNASQVNVTWAAYCHLTGRPVQQGLLPVQRAKWVAEDAFLRHMLASLYANESDRPKMRSVLAGQRIYGTFAWNDPFPFLRYSATTLFPALAADAARKICQSIFKAADGVRLANGN